MSLLPCWAAPGAREPAAALSGGHGPRAVLCPHGEPGAAGGLRASGRPGEGPGFLWASSRSGADEHSPTSAHCQRRGENIWQRVRDRAHVRGESAAVLVITCAGALPLCCSVLAAGGSRCNQSSNGRRRPGQASERGRLKAATEWLCHSHAGLGEDAGGAGEAVPAAHPAPHSSGSHGGVMDGEE